MAYNPEATPAIYPPAEESVKSKSNLSPIVLAIGLPLAIASGPIALSYLKPEFVTSTMENLLNRNLPFRTVSRFCSMIGQAAVLSAFSCGFIVKAAQEIGSSEYDYLSMNHLMDIMKPGRIATYVLAAEAYILVRNVIIK